MKKAKIDSRNIKLTIEYDGTNYCGWQIQKHKATIQSEILKAIKKITGENVILRGASRTDSGVHSLGQVANFKTTSRIPIEKIPSALNAHLPSDITIKNAEESSDDFDAQFSAKLKTYRYVILNRKTPCALMRNTSYLVKTPLNIKNIISAAQYLVGKKDFRAFATKNKNKKNTIRYIKSISIKKKNDIITFDIEGNGFLYNMVRTIVGTLLLCGLGKLKPQDVKKILESRDRKNAGQTLPAKGLCLINIKYN